MAVRDIFRVFLILSFLAAPSLCAAEGKVAIVVTKEFSQPPLVEERVPVNGRSCMDILKSCARVETVYGGGFVVSINGIKGSAKDGAWFYYVNGVMADVGAGRYMPHAGDVIQWDYHPWTSSTWVSAIIGSYPQPFLSGGCRILHSRGVEAPAKHLAELLRKEGAGNVSRELLSGEELPMGRAPLITIGTWEDLYKIRWVKDIFENRREAGLPIDFGKAGMNVFAVDGKLLKTLSSAGAIVAMKRGYGSSSRPLWIVTGTDEESVSGALELLLDHTGKISYLSGAIVSEAGVENVPWR